MSILWSSKVFPMESYSQAPQIVLRKVQSKFEGVGGSLKLFEKWLCIKKKISPFVTSQVCVLLKFKDNFTLSQLFIFS